MREDKIDNQTAEQQKEIKTAAFVVKIDRKQGCPDHARIMRAAQGRVQEQETQEEKNKQAAAENQRSFLVVKELVGDFGKINIKHGAQR